MRITVYTKFGRKIEVTAPQHIAERVNSAFRTNASFSMTLTEEGGTGRVFTIPLENIDYIEVK